MSDEFGKRIREARSSRGWSQEKLAAEIGTTQSTIERIENGGSLRSRFRHEAAAALGLRSPGQNSAEAASGTYNPPPDFFGDRDLPVFAAVEGGPGEMVISNEPIDMVPRPWFFARVKEAYAVLVTGESMLPVYDPGDMVLVNPKLPPLKGKDAIFVAGETTGDFRASIKRYLGSTPSHWIAKQFNPPAGQKEDLRLARDEWARALRVVGRYTG